MKPPLAVALGAPVAKKYSSPRIDGQLKECEKGRYCSGAIKT